MISKLDRGILFMLLSTLVASLNGAVAKILSQELTAIEIVFFRNLLGVAIILYALYHTAPKLTGGKFHLLFMRGLFGFLAMILFIYTISVIPLGEAITLNKTSPLFVSLLAFYLLKEHLSQSTIFALLIGFVGVIFITKPFGVMISYEHFLGILGGFFAAAAYATIRKIKDIYDTRVIMLSFTAVGTVIPLIFMLIAPFVNPPEAIAFLFEPFSIDYSFKVWALIAFMAVISTLSQYLLTKAYSLTKASIIGVISFANIPFSILFGWMLGDMFPDVWTYIGIGLIVVGGVLVSRGK